MSYILEALKKAQAERQLGNAPTIHAPQPVPLTGGRAAGSRKPLLVGVGAGVLVVAAGGVIAWRAAGRAEAPAVAPAALPVAAAPAAAPSVPSVPPANAPRPAVASTLDVSAPAAPAGPPPRLPPAAAPVRVAPAAPAAPAKLAPAAAPVAAAVPPAPPVSAPAPEDSLPYLQQLPEATQREVPRVSFGGYMYSANPADRLLLVDKALRHEGEEVAPGLVLEKLLPKAAVMNFRGVRYRVPY